MIWYEDENNVAEAIKFVLQYSCIYGWTAFASNKTPCADYKALDEEIPGGLRDAIKDYLEKMPKDEYRELNREISFLLGERFYVRKTAAIKVLSRLLSDGNPCENINMIELALEMQIKQRIDLLETLRAS